MKIPENHKRKSCTLRLPPKSVVRSMDDRKSWYALLRKPKTAFMSHDEGDKRKCVYKFNISPNRLIDKENNWEADTVEENYKIK